MKSKAVFVTGGSGFVGRNLIRGLRGAGYDVRALARSDASDKVVRALGAHAVRGDVLDARAMGAGMRGCWGVIHAAADTNHGQADPAQDRVNVEGTRLVFRSAREAGVLRGVQISSESVLADGRPIVGADESWPIPTRHAGNYSRTKALAECAALAESAPPLEVCAVRPRFVWGRDDTSALPQIIDAVKAGRLKWIDGGGYLTSTAHVANVVAGSIAALERGQAGQVYFLTDGAPIPFKDFLTRMLAARKVPAPSGSVPRWLVKGLVRAGTALERASFGLIRPPMSAQEYATVGHEVTVRDDRARSELGYRPVITIEQGLQELGRDWQV